MCGIWGAVNAGNHEMAEIAARSMAHRGPDDYGTYVATEPIPVALVNTRLSIIDLTEGGHQPQSTPDGRYWIVYNGETYNYEEVRDDLIALGHNFQSSSDTEVILHAYQEWGSDCLHRLRGMFAIAIWDREETSLFLARDPMGIKPLYFSRIGKRLVFGSELKSLISTGMVKRRINYTALHHYLSFYSVPAPYTMLEGVEMLPSGHYLIFKEGKVSINQYWSLPAAKPLSMDEDEIIVRLRELLEESIRLRMIADVPVGAFLSGGIDSSAVVALMTRLSGSRLKTFSIGFGEEGAGMDERSDARLIAERYKTDHTEVVVSGWQVRDQLSQILRAMDQPSGDGLNTYLVSQATGEHVKVALSGLGGDELFAGYPQFKTFQQADKILSVWDKVPGIAQSAARMGASMIPRARHALDWVESDLLNRYGRIRILFDEDRKLKLYSKGTLNKLIAPESSLRFLSHFIHPAENDTTAQLARLELLGYMSHTLLRDADAMSMAHSLEVRVPLIDHKLIEFASRIPSDMKLRDGRGKWILTRALDDILPPEVINRPKRGFEMPVAAWMKNELRDVLEDVFSERSLKNRGIFDPAAARQVYDDFRAGDQVYMYAWSLAVFELWCREFIDQVPKAI